MVSLETIYQVMPIWMQNVLCGVEGGRIKRSRYNAFFFKCLKEYEARLAWSQDQTIEYRNRKLCEFITHCERSVPYYKNLFKELAVSSEDISTLEDLTVIPVLTKEIVQERDEEFLSEDVLESQRKIAHTSGTTGGGLRFAVTPKAMSEQWAVWWRYRRLHGITLDTWCGYFGGRSVVPLKQIKPPFWRYNKPGRQIMFSGYHISENNLKYYIDELRKKEPPWLHGYPSLLTVVASYILDHNIDIGYQVNWISIGAENLLPHQVDVITNAFGVKPIQHYGMAEAVANISEHPDGQLYIDEDFAAIEFIPQEKEAGFKVIGTNFTNLATPLLRYDCGDIVQLEDNSVGNRKVIAIDGRKEDFIILKNGSKVGRMDHVFKDLVNIKEVQLQQHKIGAVDIHIVKRKTYTQQDEDKLLHEFRSRVGNDTELNILYTESIERSRTGKLRFVVSSLKEGKI